MAMQMDGLITQMQRESSVTDLMYQIDFLTQNCCYRTS